MSELRVDTQTMRSGGRGLDAVAERLREAAATLRAAVESAEGCWGDDEYGNSFQPGYHGSRDELLDGVDQLLTVLDGLGDQVRAAAGGYEQAEDDNAQLARDAG